MLLSDSGTHGWVAGKVNSTTKECELLRVSAEQSKKLRVAELSSTRNCELLDCARLHRITASLYHANPEGKRETGHFMTEKQHARVCG
jgi:hypothetical protein